jgi:hypothetical protein
MPPAAGPVDHFNVIFMAVKGSTVAGVTPVTLGVYAVSSMYGTEAVATVIFEAQSNTQSCRVSCLVAAATAAL